MIKQVIKDFELQHNVKVVYVIKSGSMLYGTNSATSDTDYIGIFIPTKESVLLKRDPEHLCITTGQANQKNTQDDIDIQLWSIYKFLNLVQKGETGALDLLFSFNAEHINDILVTADPTFFEYFRRNTPLFVSKNLQAFVGYCLGQAKKYNIKGARYSEALTFEEDFKKAIIGIDNKHSLYVIRVAIETIIKNRGFKYISVVLAKGPKRNQLNDMILYLEILGRKHALDITIAEMSTRLDRLFSSFGARTISAANGVDNKALSHATRVILECEELLNTGKVNFPLKDAELLKRIKYHQDLVQGGGEITDTLELNLENLMYYLETKLDKVNQLLETSQLRSKVDQSLIDNVIKLFVKD